MTIDDAVKSLEKHLGEDDVKEGVFTVTHDGKTITVRVAFIYRLPEVKALNGVWEGYPVSFGRVSCW